MADALQYRFTVEQVVNPQFAILDIHPDLQREARFDFSFHIQPVSGQQQVAVLIHASVHQEHKQLAVVQAGCVFRFEPDSWKALTRGDTLILPRDVAAHLTTIAFGTLRGVLYAKTEHTALRQFPVPLINLMEVFREDVALPLSGAPKPIP
jgi:hypothetical protein